MGIRIYVTTHARLYDPRNWRDRKSLIEDAIDSASESRKISDRALSEVKRRAANGLPHGRLPYGYTRTYDPVTRRFAEQVPVPEEAKVLRELNRRIRKGDSLRSIAADFKQRGITTRHRVANSDRVVDGRPIKAGELWRMVVEGAEPGLWAPADIPALTEKDRSFWGRLMNNGFAVG